MSASILNLEIVRGTTFGPIQILCKDANGAPVPLAGWSAFAEARDSPKTPVIIDLLPVIEANDTAGIITLSKIPWQSTRILEFQSIEWDLILQTPNGDRLPPFIAGKIHITNTLTQPS